MGSPLRHAFGVAMAAGAALSASGQASAQVRVMTWNVAGLQGSASALGTVLSMAHGDDRPGWAVPVDLMAFQEVTQSTLAALQSIVPASAPPGATYALATFTLASGESSAGGAVALFYRTETFSEIASGHADIATGGGRNSDRWLMQLVGHGPGARISVFGSHLKASTGSSNEAERLSGVQALRAYADALGPGVPAIYVGDYNIYSNTEPAFVAMLASGNARAVDPYGGGSWSGAANSILHSQSPRDVSGALVGGGLDDRFDLLLTTVQLADGNGLSIIPGTCRSLGNDGNHYNLAINSGTNHYFPGQAARSAQLANALFAASDHLPVVADFQEPARLAASLDAAPARVIAGAQVSVPARVWNAAAVVTPLGADALDYSVTPLQHCSASGSGVAPLAPSSVAVPVQLSTAAAGVRNARILVTSASEAVQPAELELSSPFTVLGPSRPSLMSGAEATSSTIHVPVTVGGPAVDVDVPVWNFNHQALQSALDVDQTVVPAGPVSVVVGSASGIGSAPAQLRIRVSPAGLPAGQVTVPVTIRTSDENIPGERLAQLSISVVVDVSAGGVEGDLNQDGSVNGVDLAILLSQWGGSGTADFNLSGMVDGIDLAFLLAYWTL